MKNKILIIDIETTGFLPNGEIVEVGIVELDIESGEKRIIFDKVFKPNLTSLEQIAESWIVQSGYMTTDEIIKADSIEFHKSEIQRIIDAYPNGITAYNNRFDFDFLASIGIEIRRPLPCPMKLSRPMVKAIDSRGLIKNPNVEEAYKHFFPKSNYIETHRGADDAFHEADIVFELIKIGVM